MASKKQVKSAPIVVAFADVLSAERNHAATGAKVDAASTGYMNALLSAFRETGAARDASGAEACANAIRTAMIADIKAAGIKWEGKESFNAACIAAFPPARVGTWRNYVRGAKLAFLIEGARWTTQSHNGTHIGADGQPLKVEAAKVEEPTAPGPVEQDDGEGVEAEAPAKPSTDPFAEALAVINRDAARKAAFIAWVKAHADWK